MTSMAVDDRSAIERGLARARAKRLRYWGMLGGALFLLAADMLWMWHEGFLPRDLTHPPRDAAIGLVCGYAVGVAIGIAFMLRQRCDEHEIRARMVAMTVAFAAFIIVYPPWAMLANAGVVTAVSPLALWAGAFLLYLATYAWRKFR